MLTITTSIRKQYLDNYYQRFQYNNYIAECNAINAYLDQGIQCKQCELLSENSMQKILTYTKQLNTNNAYCIRKFIRDNSYFYQRIKFKQYLVLPDTPIQTIHQRTEYKE